MSDKKELIDREAYSNILDDFDRAESSSEIAAAAKRGAKSKTYDFSKRPVWLIAIAICTLISLSLLLLGSSQDKLTKVEADRQLREKYGEEYSRIAPIDLFLSNEELNNPYSPEFKESLDTFNLIFSEEGDYEEDEPPLTVDDFEVRDGGLQLSQLKNQ